MTWKTSENNVLPVLAIDPGNKFTKVLHGRSGFMFPSIEAKAGSVEPVEYKAIQTKGSKRSPDTLDNIILYEHGRYYFVGDLAANRGRDQTEISGAARLDSNFYKRLVMAAISELPATFKGDIRIVTGMPGLWHRESSKHEDNLKNNLLGQHVISRYGKPDRSVNVVEVTVFQEPRAAFYISAINPDGSPNLAAVKDQRTAYIDIGGHSWDLAVFDGLDFLPDLSQSTNIGMNDVFNDVTQYVKSESGVDLNRQLIMGALKQGSIKVEGREIKLNGVATSAIKEAAQRGIDFMSTVWKGQDKLFDNIVVVGGSETEFLTHIKQFYGRATPLGNVAAEKRLSVSQATKCPQFGNVVGYSRYASFCDWRIQQGSK